MRSTRKSSSCARRQCCRRAHKMKRDQVTLTQLVVAAAFATLLPQPARAQDYQRRTQIDTTVRLDRAGTVDLSLISGKIRVTGWDRPDVKVVASIESGMLRFDANPS